jgi:hypothetical protein
MQKKFFKRIYSALGKRKKQILAEENTEKQRLNKFSFN